MKTLKTRYLFQRSTHGAELVPKDLGADRKQCRDLRRDIS